MCGRGPSLCALLLSGFKELPVILLGEFKYEFLGFKSMGGPKRYVLEAGLKRAGGTSNICMGVGLVFVLCSYQALQNCLLSCQGIQIRIFWF